jgi:broad specificity phosphatase PhoE
LAAIERETVVVTHFVAINAVIGAAVGDDRMVVMAVGNASVTVVDHDGDAFHLVEAPEVESTEVM